MIRYRLAAGVLRAPLEEQEVLLNLETGIYHLLNGTGRAILTRLEEGFRLEEAAARLSEETGQPLQRVLRDARAFLSALTDRGLLEARR
jgi:Coenzyme PQQ synthesis protein D (PqqD)